MLAELGSGAPLNGAHLLDSKTRKLMAAEDATADSAKANDALSAAPDTFSMPARGEQLSSTSPGGVITANGAAIRADEGDTDNANPSTPSSPVAAVKGWLSGAFAAVTGTGKHSIGEGATPKAAESGEQVDSMADAAAAADGETGHHDAVAAAALTPEAAFAAAAANGNADDCGASAEARPAETATAEANPAAADTEEPQAAPAGPAPGSIAAKIAALRAGAAKRSPDAPPPKFGLRLPFVTAESRAVGSAAAAAAPGPTVSAPRAAPAAAASADPEQSPAITGTAGDGPAADGADNNGSAADTAAASAAEVDVNGSAAADASDATPAPSPVRIVARQVHDNSFFALPLASNILLR